MAEIQVHDHVWIEKRDLVCCACQMELYAELVGETDSKCCCSCHINTAAGNGFQETPLSIGRFHQSNGGCPLRGNAFRH
jgi:hypothetical protein